MPAPLKNQNAAKPTAEQASSFLYLRCTSAEKAAWVRAANRNKTGLSEWARTQLNASASAPVK